MKVELHLHTSRYSACAVSAPGELMRGLLAAGYGAVYITEHDAVWGDRELAKLRAEFPQIRIFPGVELSIGELWSFQHLLVLGTNDPAYLGLARSARPDIRGILDKAAEAGHLTVLAHPCRWEGSDDMILRGLLPDALEFRTCNHDGLPAEMARRAGERLHLPVVNAGDVHSLEMVGCFWIETAGPLERPEDIRRVVLAGEYQNHPPVEPTP